MTFCPSLYTQCAELKSKRPCFMQRTSPLSGKQTITSRGKKKKSQRKTKGVTHSFSLSAAVSHCSTFYYVALIAHLCFKSGVSPCQRLLFYWLPRDAGVTPIPSLRLSLDTGTPIKSVQRSVPSPLPRRSLHQTCT